MIKGKPKKSKIGIKSQLLFYCTVLAVPTLQFLIFYVAVNINSILLAFKGYDIKGESSFIGWDNFAEVFRHFSETQFIKDALVNSLVLGFFTIVVGISFALLFSYYIYKKKFFSGVFKVFLYVPQIVSSLVLVIIFKYMAEDAYIRVMQDLFGVKTLGLLSSPNTQFTTVMIYSIFVGFGPQVLMYSGAMSGISDSIVEAGQLDGITPLREFFQITIPMIWPTVTSFIVVNLANVFVNQMQLFSFYGTNAEYRLYTLGYYLYSMMKKTSTSIMDYPYLSAFGLVLTLFTIPATLIVRKLLERMYRVE